MATSGTYTFTVTRDDIIREAMLNIGKLDVYGQIDPSETLDCARKLNMMVKTWMGRLDYAPGLKMWTRQRGDLFLSSIDYSYNLGPTGDNWAGGCAKVANANYGSATLTTGANAAAVTLFVGSLTSNFTVNDYIVVELDSGDIYSTTCAAINTGAGSVTLASGLPSSASAGNFIYNYTTKAQRPLEIVTAILRDSNQNDTPLDYMTLQTYEALPTKTSQSYVSDPTAIYYEPQIGNNGPSGANGVLYIDCGGAQDVTKQIHIVYLRPVQDFNNPLDNPEYPQEWYSALCWGLSKQIAPMFNAPWGPVMEENFQEAVAFARHSNTETSEVYFQCNAGNP